MLFMEESADKKISKDESVFGSQTPSFTHTHKKNGVRAEGRKTATTLNFN